MMKLLLMLEGKYHQAVTYYDGSIGSWLYNEIPHGNGDKIFIGFVEKGNKIIPILYNSWGDDNPAEGEEWVEAELDFSGKYFSPSNRIFSNPIWIAKKLPDGDVVWYK